MQFVGENMIQHTPAEQTVKIISGNAFDLATYGSLFHSLVAFFREMYLEISPERLAHETPFGEYFRTALRWGGPVIVLLSLASWSERAARAPLAIGASIVPSCIEIKPSTSATYRFSTRFFRNSRASFRCTSTVFATTTKPEVSLSSRCTNPGRTNVLVFSASLRLCGEFRFK